MAENVTVQPLSDEILREIEQLIESGAFSEALERIQPLSRQELEPADAVRLHHFHGVALFRVGRSPEAVSRFRKSFEAAEAAGDVVGQARALEQLGGVHHNEKRLQDALTHYERALRLWAKVGDRAGEGRGHRNLGNVHMDLNEASRALEDYERSRTIFKELGQTDEMAPAVIHSASIAYQQKGLAAAIEAYRRSLSEDGCRHYLVLNNYGFQLMLQDQFEEAMGLLDEARADLERRDAPQDDVALVHLNLGNGKALQGDLKGAEEHFRKAGELLEQYPEARAVEILLQANEKHRDQGFHKYLVVDNGQKRALAHLNLATLMAWTGRIQEAEAEARRAVEMDRTAAYPYLAAGWIHLVAGDERAATESFRRARGMEPDNEEFRKALDLVNPYVAMKVGRNDACPCGSGKKFKKCHGAV